MRVLMLGWEFPPHITGGLGTACLGLTRAMAAAGVDVSFVMPTGPEEVGPKPTHLRLLSAKRMAGPEAGAVAPQVAATLAAEPRPAPASAAEPGVTLHPLAAAFRHPYPASGPPVAPPDGLDAWLNDPAGSPLPTPAKVAPGAAGPAIGPGPYEGDLPAAALEYAHRCVALAAGLEFDVIHAHDWLTFPAAAAVARASGRPWVAHVHSLESDRAGGLNPGDPRIDAVERAGLRAADAIIAVSRRTGDLLIRSYGLPAQRVTVVYNGVELSDNTPGAAAPGAGGGQSLPDHLPAGEKIVLFLGRVTAQKGPQYFLAAARRVLEKFTDVRFVVAGTGDQSAELVRAVEQMGISDRVVFTGFLGGEDVDRVFRMADLYVMPSVSEPFGIAPLEAIQHDVPVIISKQSGVSEVLEHVLKVDFWDTDDLASKMLAVLRHPPLGKTLREHAGVELRRLNWRDAADRCVEVYESLCSKVKSAK